MLDYYQLEALMVVAREGSFVSAAYSLGITQSALSQKIKLLEQKMGAPLVIRTTPAGLTELGIKLVNHCRQVQHLETHINELQSKNTAENRPLRLPIALNTESLSTWFLPTVAELLTDLNILLELYTADQDKTDELLREGRVLGCISSEHQAPNGCASYSLKSMSYRLVCTPSFFKKYFDSGVTFENLKRAPAAIYGPDDELHDIFLRRHFSGFEKVRPNYTFVPSAEGLVQITKIGQACCFLPEFSVVELMRAKTLVDLLPKKTFKLKLFWHVYSEMNPVLTKFTERLVANSRNFII